MVFARCSRPRGPRTVAQLDLAFDDAALVAVHRRLHLDRVLDDHARSRVAQLAGVADLAAALGVEGRVVEHDDDVVAGLGLGDRVPST
jgi:hypothetical protein